MQPSPVRLNNFAVESVVERDITTVNSPRSREIIVMHRHNGAALSTDSTTQRAWRLKAFALKLRKADRSLPHLPAVRYPGPSMNWSRIKSSGARQGPR